MGREIVGSSAEELREVGAAMRKMLKEGGPPPQGRWSDLAVLEPVSDYRARHASTLLVFDAVEEAIARSRRAAVRAQTAPMPDRLERRPIRQSVGESLSMATPGEKTKYGELYP